MRRVGLWLRRLDLALGTCKEGAQISQRWEFSAAFKAQVVLEG